MRHLIFLLFLFNKYSFIQSFIPLDTKIKIIEFSSHLLPNIDTIGHKLLLNNQIVIKNILELNSIPVEIRKHGVLDIIRITEYGDKFGGFILANYHDIVDKLL